MNTTKKIRIKYGIERTFKTNQDNDLTAKIFINRLGLDSRRIILGTNRKLLLSSSMRGNCEANTAVISRMTAMMIRG